MIRSRRIGLAHTILAAFALGILVQAARVQLVERKRWLAKATAQQSSARTIPAPRGDILDATRRVLAQSRETVRLEIAPWEVKQPAKLRRALVALKVDPALIARAIDPKSKYLVLPNRFPIGDAAAAILLKGVHSNVVVMRSYAASEGAQGILGRVDANNNAIDGLELALDSILRGTPGETTIFKVSKGQGRESPLAPGTDPTNGSSVVLTINADLQEIAEKSLADAVARTGAEGGDIVILDPRGGEILAMASRRLDPRQTSATVLTEPFEPGSTAKPFMVAGLLERGRVADTDSVDTGDGVLEVPGRSSPIRDDHLVGRAPLSVVLRWSSNIGIIKFSERLNDREKFETLRDFGFGTPTGLPFPTESPGVLRSPKSWSKQSPYSLPMGYEMSATPLQLATAYAVFANGGQLVQPALVKEVIGPDGTVRYRHSPRVVRQVVSKPVADKVRRMLLDVVDEGTALEAAIDSYQLAGKTGTPRATVRGHYVHGRYNPNFVGIFPGDNPQYVIVVKMTAPQSSIYAAKTAAPVTKVILQAAIAARDAALDRTRLASSVMPSQKSSRGSGATEGSASADLHDSATTDPVAVQQTGAMRDSIRLATDDSTRATRSVPFVVTLPWRAESTPARVAHRVPDVRGLVLRDAVRSLHSAGFRVQLARSRAGGTGSTATIPAAGDLAPTGTLVRLIYY